MPTPEQEHRFLSALKASEDAKNSYRQKAQALTDMPPELGDLDEYGATLPTSGRGQEWKKLTNEHYANLSGIYDTFVLPTELKDQAAWLENRKATLGNKGRPFGDFGVPLPDENETTSAYNSAVSARTARATSTRAGSASAPRARAVGRFEGVPMTNPAEIRRETRKVAARAMDGDWLAKALMSKR